MGTRNDTKSMKNRGGVTAASRKRFGRVLDARKALASTRRGLFLESFWGPVLVKNRKNGIQKGIQKSMPKKGRHFMPKLSKNETKMVPKSMQNQLNLETCDFPIFATCLQ